MQSNYDLSEFGPPNKKSISNKSDYDLSEFGPKKEPINAVNSLDALSPIINEHLPGVIPLIKGIRSSSLGKAGKDVVDIAKGIPGAAINAIGNIPKDIDYLKENIPSSWNLIQNNPESALKSSLAGAGEFAGRVSNLPPAIVDYLSKIGMIKPETAKQFARPYSNEEVTQAMNKFEGEQKPGQELIRGVFRNPEKIYAAGKLSQVANPMRYTKSSIARDVLREEERQMGIHTKAYNDLWKNAGAEGYGKVPINSHRINMNLIKKYPNQDYWITTEKFLKNPTLSSAHEAQSDLGKLINDMKKNPQNVPPSEKIKIRKAAREAQKYIKDRMFRDNKGNLNPLFKNQYNTITQSYGDRVIPYTTNKPLQAYKSKDITLDELINGLKTGRFARRRGSNHPEIAGRDKYKNLLKFGAGIAGISGGVSVANHLINKLLGKNNS